MERATTGATSEAAGSRPGAMDAAGAAGSQPKPQGHPELRPGDVVRHFKRETVPAEEIAAGSTRYLYRYLGVARHSETQEPLALYQALYPPFGLWVRPLAMFLGEVDHGKYPDIRQRWRFAPADPVTGDLL